MVYTITKYSYDQAKKLGVEIKPSTNPSKKIDVYKDNKKICSIGDINYGDYPTFIIQKGKEYADKRRELYMIRHKKHKDIVDTKSYYAARLLW